MGMKINKKVRLSFFIVALLVVAIGIGSVIAWKLQDTEPRRVPKQQRGDKPTSTLEDSFLLNEVYYDCSKKIHGEWVEAKVGQLGGDGYYFYPASQSEYRKYCREGAVIEYHAVLDVIGRDDVNKVIEKHDTTQAWVKALGHKYIHDTSYMDRILPAYSNMKIDCVIVVHSPEGTRFFLEDGDKKHEYVEVPAAEFLTLLNKASDADVNDFWLGLH